MGELESRLAAALAGRAEAEKKIAQLEDARAGALQGQSVLKAALDISREAVKLLEGSVMDLTKTVDAGRRKFEEEQAAWQREIAALRAELEVAPARAIAPFKESADFQRAVNIIMIFPRLVWNYGNSGNSTVGSVLDNVEVDQAFSSQPYFPNFLLSRALRQKINDYCSYTTKIINRGVLPPLDLPEDEATPEEIEDGLEGSSEDGEEGVARRKDESFKREFEDLGGSAPYDDPIAHLGGNPSLVR